MCEHNQEDLPCWGCINDYQPRHQTRHSNAYYATRSFVRGIVYTLLAVTAVAVFCASVIILGAAF